MGQFEDYPRIRVSDDGLEAFFEPNPDTTDPISLKDLTRLINHLGIQSGIDKTLIKTITAGELQPGKSYKIASGIPPQRGLDAELLFCFRVPDEGGNNLPDAKMSSGGKFTLASCKLAKKNEVLAIKLRATDGNSGLDVFGNSVSPESGVDVTLDAGKNVQTRYYPDKIEYSALCEGLVNLSEGRLEVNSLCIIDHDVDLSTGNVDFVGNLLILGDVHRGFKVVSQGSIKIQGKVDGGTLSAAGDIEVVGNVMGSSDLRSGGNIKCQFIEHSRVEADGNVNVADGIVNCDLICSGRLTVTAGRGVIAGGKIKAKAGIEAQVIGSSIGTQTDLSIGGEFIENKKMVRLEMELNTLEQEIGRLQATLKPFLGKDPTLASLPSDKRWALKSLANRLKDMRIKRNRLRQRLSSYNQSATFQSTKPPRVDAHQRVWQGVRIFIGTSEMEIDHELNNVSILKSASSNDIRVADLSQI